jgi:hypothetical protein
MKNLLVVFSLLVSFNSYAGIWAKIGPGKLDGGKRAHIVVAGVGHEGFNIFQQAAVTKGLKYKEIYPDDEVVILLNPEVSEKDNLAWLKERNVNVLHSNGDGLTFSYIMNAVSYFDKHKVISIDIYSHSAIKYGIQLTIGPDGNIFPDDETKISKFKKYMHPGGYVVLHGCNSGFAMAPLFSQILGVPAFGSFTSTDFQEKITTNEWFFNNTDDRPVGAEVENSLKCRQGLCTRMKPRNAPYIGYWGSFSGGGLSFYKQFCVGVTDYRCKEVLARYTQDFVGAGNLHKKSTFEEYKLAVQDILCPIHPRSNIRKECADSLKRAEEDRILNSVGSSKSYNPFRGAPLNCSMTGCDFYFENAQDPKNVNAIKLINTGGNYNTTFIDEYFRYLDSYQFLKKLEWGG